MINREATGATAAHFTLGAGVQPVIRARWSYTDESETFFNDIDPSNTRIGDHFLLNASFYYENWQGTLFVNNPTDELAFVDVFTLNGLDTFTVPPRTFGVPEIVEAMISTDLAACRTEVPNAVGLKVE
jgi:hypothetical protein